ncbi:MAG: EF-P lysine aminoacylase GenX [Acidobacteria bacterium]|nr:MAG: EF-P lysine aminoacylase GenX [Acidobacteriota bacterium]REK00231.1 MAG: EF-P lysine aminoacylase GenX [Acidobacteriota bacterium]
MSRGEAPAVAWRPRGGRRLLELRARALGVVRSFFARRGVLEVDTPLLQTTAATDLHLDSVPCEPMPGVRAYLPTSPETAMKRLLADGSGPIFQVCKSFRRGELGSRHRPEFTMVEWYRPGFTLEALQNEVDDLVRAVVVAVGAPRSPLAATATVRYEDVWRARLGIDPHTATAPDLRQLACRHLPAERDLVQRLEVDDLLGLLMARLVEPGLQTDGPVFVHDFPASSAAMARLRERADGVPVACRFELYLGGLEVANAYLELTEPTEQEARQRRDLAQRAAAGRPGRIDERFLAALRHGLPATSGVALGFDRLLMFAVGASDLDEVLPLSWEPEPSD